MFHQRKVSSAELVATVVKKFDDRIVFEDVEYLPVKDDVIRPVLLERTFYVYDQSNYGLLVPRSGEWEALPPEIIKDILETFLVHQGYGYGYEPCLYNIEVPDSNTVKIQRVTILRSQTTLFQSFEFIIKPVEGLPRVAEQICGIVNFIFTFERRTRMCLYPWRVWNLPEDEDCPLKMFSLLDDDEWEDLENFINCYLEQDDELPVYVKLPTQTESSGSIMMDMKVGSRLLF